MSCETDVDIRVAVSLKYTTISCWTLLAGITSVFWFRLTPFVSCWDIWDLIEKSVICVVYLFTKSSFMMLGTVHW